MRLVLASASPRRAELLAAAGFTFDVLATDVDEQVRPGEQPHDYVRRLAMEKSAAAARLLSTERGHHADAGTFDTPAAGSIRTGGAPRDVLIIGADTAVIVDHEILGKPVDDADGERMLRQLSGRPHLVMTGVSVRSADRQVDAVDETLVFVSQLTDRQIAWYVSSGEGRDKAGGYAIQGLASRFIPRIEGSYSNVVGLPVAQVAELIARLSGAGR